VDASYCGSCRNDEEGGRKEETVRVYYYGMDRHVTPEKIQQ
jgi:hypothetical protein